MEQVNVAMIPAVLAGIVKQLEAIDGWLTQNLHIWVRMQTRHILQKARMRYPKSAILAKFWWNGKSALPLRRETKKHHETDTIILQTARRFRQILLDASADGVF